MATPKSKANTSPIWLQTISLLYLISPSRIAHICKIAVRVIIRVFKGFEIKGRRSNLGNSSYGSSLRQLQPNRPRQPLLALLSLCSPLFGPRAPAHSPPPQTTSWRAPKPTSLLRFSERTLPTPWPEKHPSYWAATGTEEGLKLETFPI